MLANDHGLKAKSLGIGLGFDTRGLIL